ncbi:hypothetical protein Zmor_022056 [Zophobas morio]|uniref:Gustatory receptor n=1 Tax=Zophobas morio TaxID=2755281 RepID=A0AA38MBH5_9CUCU|nr:hypothetical protein Zmor_022056 [Zophobas morio]
MASTSSDIHTIIGPIFAFWKFTGFPAYKLKQNLKFLYFSSANFYLSLVGLILLFVFALYYKSETIDGVIIDDPMSITGSTTLFVQNIGILVLSHRKRTDILRVVEALRYSESLIQKLKKRNVSYTNKVKSGVLKLAVVKYSLTIVVWIVDGMNIPDAKISLAMYYFNWGFHYAFELAILTYFIILKNQYQELNQLLSSQNFRLVDCQTTKDLVTIYSFLKKICDLIRNMSEVFVLMKVVCDTIITSIAVFYVVRVYKVYPENLLLSVVSDTMFFTLTAISNFTLAFVFHGLLKKVI